MSFTRHLSAAKEWLKQKSKSKPFQVVISIGQGLSLGSSVHDALTKVLLLSTVTGLGAGIFAYTNYGVAGTIAILMSYMTYNYVHTNIRSTDSTTEQLTKHDAQHFLHDNRMSSIQNDLIKTLQVVSQDQNLTPETRKELVSLSKQMSKSLKNFQEHINMIGHPAHAQPELLTSGRASIDAGDEKYYPLEEVSVSATHSPRLQTPLMRQGSQSDRFFDAVPNNPPVLAFPKMNPSFLGKSPQAELSRITVVPNNDEHKSIGRPRAASH